MGLGVGKAVKYDPTITVWEIAAQQQGKKSIVAQATSSTKKADGTYDNFSFQVYFVGDAARKIQSRYPNAVKFDSSSKLRIDIMNGDFNINRVPRKKEDGTPITFTTKDGREMPTYNTYPSLTVFDFNFKDGNNQSSAQNKSANDSSFVNIPDSLAGSEDYLPFN